MRINPARQVKVGSENSGTSGWFFPFVIGVVGGAFAYDFFFKRAQDFIKQKKELDTETTDG